ncbi:MAG: hypothetical protein QOG53_3255 [Frankiales bacterium]|jgi:hypothetical protein|nr:hypothetical protein [Frankiales bacterium]
MTSWTDGADNYVMDTTISATVPAPRTATPASAYEQGGCGSSLVHAARKTLQGHKALCDGSPIIEWHSGRFDATATQACPDCAAAVSVTH